jgi:3-methyladenine DNA glycosylase AlkC
MAALKEEISPGLARVLGDEIGRVWAGFPQRRFIEGLAEVLEPLELMARVEAVTDRLAEALPEDFGEAAAVIEGALGSPAFDGWMVLPVGTYVARAGIEKPDLALPLLAGLTPRWTSEWAIRAFIERHPELTYGYLAKWAADPDEHVRRLVSEGTRPRLPWARQLRSLIDDPGPNLPLLDRLVDDPSAYVRRSVANHLNDIAKDHPDLALDLAGRWLPRGESAAWVVGHGLRTPVKKGDPRALQLLGVATDADVRLTAFTVDRDTLAIGDAVTFSLTVELHGREEADAVIDYRVHYVGANGGRKQPKVFKLTRQRLVAGTPTTLTRRHGFHHVSIRRIRPGRHTLDVQVNGRVLGSLDLDVRA